MWGEGSISYLECVIQAYMSRYATEERIGRPIINEDIARIHNGGPNGWKNENTIAYWRNVARALQRVVAGKRSKPVVIMMTESMIAQSDGC